MDTMMEPRVAATFFPALRTFLVLLSIAVVPAKAAEPGEGIVVLGRTGDDRHDQTTLCLAEQLAKARPRQRIVPARQFRDSLFPFFEANTAPEDVAELSALIGKPGVRQRIEGLGVRYVITAMGDTSHGDTTGLFGCGGGYGGGGCFGFESTPETTKIAAAIWDLEDPELSRETDASMSGSNVLLGLLLPIPIPADSEGKACGEMARQVASFLDGKPVPGSMRMTSGESTPTDSNVRQRLQTPAVRRLELARVMDGCAERSACLSVAISPDGTIAAAGDMENQVWLWEFASGKSLGVLYGGRTRAFKDINRVEALAFSPDGKYVLAGGMNDQAVLWEVASRTQRLTVGDHGKTGWKRRGVESVAFSTDGKRIATGGFRGDVKVWDSESGALLHTLAATEASPDDLHMAAVAFARKQPLLATFVDGELRIWETASGERIGAAAFSESEGYGVPGGAVKFSGNGRVLAVATCSHLKLFDVPDDGPPGPGTLDLNSARTVDLFAADRGKYPEWCGSGLGFSPDGARLFVTSMLQPMVREVDVATGELVAIHEWPATEYLYWLGSDIAITPDGDHLGAPSMHGIKLWALARD